MSTKNTQIKELKWNARRDFVLLKTPKQKETKLLMTPESQAELDREILMELKVCEVAAAGPDSALKTGDKVPMTIQKLKLMEIIEIDEIKYLVGIDSWFPVVIPKK